MLCIKLSCFFILIPLSVCITTRQIPDYLLPCYKNSNFSIHTPNNVQLLVELLAKIEKNNTSYNIRTISKSVLHSMRLDGIERATNVIESERVVPYRATAFQYEKYSFLFNNLIPTENVIPIHNDLSQRDICILHLLISSTVDSGERGDEFKTCPLSMPKDSTITQVSDIVTNFTKAARKSRCPVEKGVVQTPWGNISPGTLFAGISAALEPQNVQLQDLMPNVIQMKSLEKFNDDTNIEKYINDITKKSSNNMFISNVLAATLTGDLAELAIKQGPLIKSNVTQQYKIGPMGRWNDSLLPRNLYLLQEQPLHWEMTDAEILAGIDGYIIANFIKNWTDFRQNTRLSQVVEMYYSSYGVAYDNNVRACNRKRNFLKFLKSAELKEQTLNLVYLLWFSLSNVYMESKEIENVSNDAVQAFLEYWPKLIETIPGCDVKGDTNPMNVMLVTDQTWNKYETQQLISILSETLDVSYQGCSLSILHGTTGEWITEPTNSIIDIFSDIANSTNTWVDRIDLRNVLTTIVTYLESKNQYETENILITDLPRVFVFVAPNSKWSQSELERARTIMESIRKSYLDVYFVFYMSDQYAFQQLAVDQLEHSDILINSTSTRLVEVAENLRLSFIEKTIPKRILPVPCGVTVSQYNLQSENYISVGQKIIYRIHPRYLIDSSNVEVNFQAVTHGEMSICKSRYYSEDKADSCKILDGERNLAFNIYDPCKEEPCKPIYFIIRARATYINCADKDCRYPDQIRFIVRHKGLKCIGEDKNSAAPRLQHSVYQKLSFVIFSSLHLILLSIVLNK